MFKQILLGTILTILISCNEKPKPIKTRTLFIGTYTEGASEGIYTLQFNTKTGVLDSLELKAKLPNPSFLALSKNKEYVFAIQETADFDSLGGGVTAFKLNDGNFKKINSKGTGGAHPCHVALSDDGQLAISNYTGGNLAVFDIAADGSLGTRQLIDHNKLDTTKIAHVHKAHFNEGGLFAADLGLSAIKRYKKESTGWTPAHQATIQLSENAGSRHFIFNTERSFLYVINELNSTIAVFEKDDEGSYNSIQTVPTIAPDWTGQNACADIHLSPDGKFLYGTNRGENTIVIFSVDEGTGKLNLIGRESVQGDWPRNFTIDPTGNFLLVANQKSNNISVFERNKNGALLFVDDYKVDRPVCLIFN